MHTSGASATAAAVDKAIDAMLEKAALRRATDIHIEPRERTIAVRFRIDGRLSEAAKLPLPALDGLASNLKTRAGLEPREARTPQSGTFEFASKHGSVTIHIASMPTVNGEKISIHLAPQVSEPATLESLGYWGDALKRIERAAGGLHGLIVASSPDRTGTTLSLLGIVHLLNNPTLNIATLEDRIEQHVAGISQTQIDAASGLDFGNGLQAVLKQDPNVVMLSDLAGRETVGLALQAAMSGQLMLGGVHANSAAYGVAQLLHMNTEPYLIAAALKLAVGQRFVRRLCPSCREAYQPDEALRRQLRQLLALDGVASMRVLHELERNAAADNIGASGPNSFGTSETGIVRLWRAHPDGCPHCRFSGFSGRVGICEALASSEAMQKLIARRPPAQDIQKLAVAEGMLPLRLDALIKALRGLTTFEEIRPLVGSCADVL